MVDSIAATMNLLSFRLLFRSTQHSADEPAKLNTRCRGAQELKELMALHGGRFENYYYKSTVTHVVCDHLPDTKLKQLLKSKSATPIVRAAWIVESIAAGRLLPPGQFSIDRLAINPAQQRMRELSSGTGAALQRQDIFPQLRQDGAEPQPLRHVAQSPATGVPQDRPPSRLDHADSVAPQNAVEAMTPASVGVPHRVSSGHTAGPAGAAADACKQGRRTLEEGALPAHAPAAPTPTTGAQPGTAHDAAVRASMRPQQSGGPIGQSSHLTQLDAAVAQPCAAESSPDARTRHSPPPQSGEERAAPVYSSPPVLDATTWTAAQIAAAQRVAAKLRSECDVLKMAPRSSADDPDFLATYFKASRLHFIGTWKMRIEELMRRNGATSEACRPPAVTLFDRPRGKQAAPERSVPAHIRARTHLVDGSSAASSALSTVAVLWI